MTTTCPACNKSVDPLRSRFVAVVGGKVVAYCSAACVDAQRGRPADPPRRESPSTGVPTRIATPVGGVSAGPPRPATPPPGVLVSVDSGPVIEILHEPASGVVTSARDERTERAKHPDEIPIAVFWSADKEQSASARAAGESSAAPAKPAGSDRTDRTDRTGGTDRTSRTDRTGRTGRIERDDTLDRWASDESGTGISSELEQAPRRRVRILVLILLLLVAGGVYAYLYVVKNGLAAATTPPAPVAPARSAPAAAVEPKPARAAPLDAAATVARARATLAGQLAATSPRLQRIAASALARTQDPAARDVLAGQLGLAAAGAPPADIADIGELAKLDLAYSLARGGDPRGSEALAAALGSRRAELRDESARLLALLGDPRAAPHLIDLLAVSQRRLGAAEHLAHLAEPHAVKVLQQVLAEARASADDKARAAIALGIAGHAEVAPSLRAMLDDPHFNAFAAAALAELKDAAARPILEYQLDSPSLRVRAARALRRLDPGLDAAPLVARLLDVLQRGRDTDQVQAAEAILVLAGPPAWSTYE